MLVIGLDKVEDYKNLPSVSNGYSLALPFRFKDIYRLWPILILIIGILCLRKKKFKYKDLQGRSLGPHSRAWRIFGLCIIIFGLLFLFNNFPFYDFRYDQYHGEQGIGPYQNLIDYVNSKGGLTFWAHPEAENIEKRDRISIETREYTDHLLEAYGYTGFTIFYEGYEKVGRPGGIWDEVLKQYCQGIRDMPVWTIMGLCFDQGGDLNEYMKDLRIIVLIPQLSKQAVLKALREGKMYVVRGLGDEELILDKFIIKDSLSDVKGIMGDEINLKGKPEVEISGHFSNGKTLPVKIKLIRNGIIVREFEVKSPFEIDYQDNYFAAGEKIYYRIEIHYPRKMIVTNPIFVRFKF